MNIKEAFKQIIYSNDSISISVTDIFIVAITIIALYVSLKLLSKILTKKVHEKKLDEGKTHSIFIFFRYLVWLIFFVAVLESVGVKLSLLFAGSAALLVGVGIGLQKLFKDVISGILILFEGSIKINEVIEIDGQVGQIESIKLRTSRMRTRDNILLIIPNSRFIESEVINWSEADKKTRFFVEVGVDYSCDTKKVKEILYNIALENINVFKSPEPFVRLSDFGDSALVFRLYFWTDQNFLIENIKSDLRFNIIEKFRSNNITIPFPQRDLHVKSQVDI
ncbi:MAG: mechanosensitive ion channel [Bacteroidales bacterium]|nr:mechanosensitive ion channel [Bacteroidales bacterium]